MDIDVWHTKADETIKLQKQIFYFSLSLQPSNSYQKYRINPSKTYQTIDGFGYTLNRGSVEVINQLSSAKRAFFTRTFGNGENSIGVSYLRLSIGASDLK